MEKRSCRRISSHIEISYFLWNPLFWKKKYSGTIRNISEKGMFIQTRTPNFPLDSLLEIYITFREKTVFLPAKVSNIVWRRLLSDDSCDSIGIELTDPPEEFIEFVNRLRET